MGFPLSGTGTAASRWHGEQKLERRQPWNSRKRKEKVQAEGIAGERGVVAGQVVANPPK